MPRINTTSNTSAQPISSQDAAAPPTNSAMKYEPQESQQSSKSEQQQNKAAAVGRKSEMDLQGTLKKSELAQFGGPPKGSEAHAAELLHNSQKELAEMRNNPLVKASLKVQETIDQLEQQKNYATPEGKKSIEIVQGQLADVKDHLAQYYNSFERKLTEFVDAFAKRKGEN